MIKTLNKENSIVGKFIGEIRNIDIQKDKMRFRKNLERIGEVCAYEISKTLVYKEVKIITPLGTAKVNVPAEDIVLCAILRAALPMHQGFLNVFDDAENAFAGMYRQDNKSGGFEIHMDYFTTPNLDGKVLILIDPMLATGSTIEHIMEALPKYGTPKKIIIASAIGSVVGVKRVKRLYSHVDLWVGAIDEELTAKAYIVPGLGDAGDLAYGPKI